MSEERYINFPIQLLDGFLKDSKKVLNDINDYALYDHFLKMEYGNKADRRKASEDYFKISLADKNKTYSNGKKLYESIDSNSPKVGIKISIWWDYYKNHKTEFEKVTLLGYLALKSIVQNKAYCKVTLKFWFARMDGKAKSCEFDELSDEMKKYHNNYQPRKIKSELVNNWNLITYSRYTRGFYVSFKLDLPELVYQAEKRRKSTLEKQKKMEEHEAISKALLRLKI